MVGPSHLPDEAQTASTAPSPAPAADPLTRHSASAETPALSPVPGSTLLDAEDQHSTLHERRFGQYDLLEEVARGGMGIVYRARHRTLGRIVALKTMRAEALGHTDHAQRFDREMRATARLNHPGIVPIYDVGRHEGEPYYTMAFLSGGNLTRHRARLQADTRAAVRMIEKVARALHYAHEQGVIHRDLKPGNILLDETSEPRVTDFGLAKFLDADFDITQTGAVLGTPSYMAPEQASGRTAEICPATDVWALGVMLYELVLGRRPFVGDTGEEVKRRILQEETPVPRSLRADIDPGLELILLRCLHKEPSRRYDSARALADDLANWLRGGKTAPQRHARRSRILAGAAAVFLIAAAAYLLFREGPRTPPGPEAVVLLGSSGMPTALTWSAGEKDATLLAAGADEGFGFASATTSLLELMAKPASERFRLEAEVCHRESLGMGSNCGIFVAREAYPARQGTTHALVQLAFADHGTSKGRAELRVGRLLELGPDLFAVARGGPSTSFTPAKTRWRSLAMIVTPQEVRVVWGGTDLGSRSTTEIAASMAQFTAPERAAYSIQGGLGVYCHRAAAYFRNVKFTPLSAP